MMRLRSVLARLVAIALTTSLLSHWLWNSPSQAQALACQALATAMSQKAALLQVVLAGNVEAQKTYRAAVVQQGQQLAQCRSQTAQALNHRAASFAW
ncbi:MAG: hypothetical protein H7Z11_13620 [Verrucomicrobia bacterium]|nr:hypothetical protein [Leptolyngbya sp. ES-bin-22]